MAEKINTMELSLLGVLGKYEMTIVIEGRTSIQYTLSLYPFKPKKKTQKKMFELLI